MPFLLLQDPASIPRGAHKRPLANNSALLPPDSGYHLCVTSPSRVLGPVQKYRDVEFQKPIWLVTDGYARSADSEDPIYLLLEWAAECIYEDRPALIPKSLRGCFVALAVQPSNGKILVCRDQLGGRTAYYGESATICAVSSTSSRIARHPHFGTDESTEFITNWLCRHQQVPPRQSAFAHIREILPGESLYFFRNQRSGNRRRFHPSQSRRIRSTPEWVDRFSEAFQQAVQRSLPEDSDVAIMLSGGLDSGPSAVAAESYLRKQKRELVAISWLLKDFDSCDESQWIQRLVSATNVAPIQFEASGMLPFSPLDDSVISDDSPVYNPFRTIILRCYRLAAEKNCRVLLNAASGDQIYPPGSLLFTDAIFRFKLALALKALHSSFRTHGIRKLHRNPGVRLLLRTLANMLVAPGPRPVQRPDWIPKDAPIASVERNQWPSEIQTHRFPGFAESLIGAPMANGVAHENAYAAPYSIERRDPFQDLDLVKLMWKLPAELSRHNGQEKWIMREAMRGKLPDALRNKSRTGLLDEFYSAGFHANKAGIRELLTANQEWKKWFDPTFVNESLSADRTPVQNQLVLAKCVGYALWKEKLKK